MRMLIGLAFLVMTLALTAGESVTTLPTALSLTSAAPNVNIVAATTSETAANEELPDLTTSLEALLGEPLEELIEEITDEEGGSNDLVGLSNISGGGGGAASEVYSPMSPQHKDVQSLVSKFMQVYQSEIDVTNLDASVLRVVKAEKTAVRSVLAERSVSLGIDVIEEELAQQFRIVVLVKYLFQSSMLADKRPYVTAMRVTMECANATSPSNDNELACAVLEHFDLPRTNESTTDVPTYLQRAIVHSAPPTFAERNKSALANVHYDAIESQDLLFDGAGAAMHGVETMKYLRFRVTGADTQDCMIVVQHAQGVSTLLYSDPICFSDYMAFSLAMTALQFTKDNSKPITVVAAVVVAIAGVVMIYRRRTYKRSGYSYLPSKHGLPRLASQCESTKTSINTDIATVS